jgi:hypothetical protein
MSRDTASHSDAIVNDSLSLATGLIRPAVIAMPGRQPLAPHKVAYAVREGERACGLAGGSCEFMRESPELVAAGS